MGLRRMTQCGGQHSEQRFHVEKYEMVAIHASERYEIRPVQLPEMEA